MPGKTVNVLQCTGDGHDGTASCGLAEGHVLVPDPSGEGSIAPVIHTGPFADGTCDAAHRCSILINDWGRSTRTPSATSPSLSTADRA